MNDDLITYSCFFDENRKGAAKGVDVAKDKTMQCKMKLHYASTGNHKTMKLSDLEKLTSGQYNVLNILLENEMEKKKEINVNNLVVV